MKMLFQLDIVSDMDYAHVIASGAPNNPAQPKSSVSPSILFSLKIQLYCLSSSN